MSKAKELAARARARLRDEEGEVRRMGASLATSYVIGSMENSGAMASVPQLLGLPRTVTLAVAAKVAGTFMSGKLRDYAQGVGDAASNIATYNFAKGATISGEDEVSGRRRRRAHEAARLERDLRQELAASSAENDADLDELERASYS